MENKDIDNFLNKKLEETQNKQRQQAATKKNKKSKKKIAIVAIILAFLTAITSFVVSKLTRKEDKDDGYEKPIDTIVDTDTSFVEEDLDDVSALITEEKVTLDSLGMELEISEPEEENKKEYGETTGEVNKEEIVNDEDGINWVDEEAESKSDEVGKTEIDDKEGTLEVESDGDVVEKDEYYEITKEDGSTITGVIEKNETEDSKTNDNNESEIPDGYEYDENLDKVVAEEDANKFVYVDADYYDMNGELIFSKGEIVLKETFEKIKKDSNLITTKPVVEESKEEESKVEEVVPEVSTPQEVTPEVSTPEVSTPQEVTPEVSESTEKDETSNEAVVDSYGGVVNEDGTYTITYDIEGEIISITYMDKATYEYWLLDENAEENYGYYNGIIYPKSVIDEMNNQIQKTK